MNPRRYLIRLAQVVCTLVALSCNPQKHVLVVDYMNDLLGAGPTGDNLVIISEGEEERVVSNAIISVFQEREVSFVDLEPTLQLRPEKEYTTDPMHLTNNDILVYNEAVSSQYKLKVGPNYRVFFKVYYVVDDTELRFRIKSNLEVKGLGQGEYKEYRRAYSSKYFFGQLSSRLNAKLKQNEG